jgi:hypothetical protein
MVWLKKCGHVDLRAFAIFHAITLALAHLFHNQAGGIGNKDATKPLGLVPLRGANF